ncbi:MAG: hypothetical protein RL095_1947 [Verrucomicrobiota bacterium]|jgi:2-C-methyl-D-erythritol 2,4-cyclodiphosphate synthase
MELRIGQGCDSHRLVAGRPFILGGVAIPHEFGLAGHSDADALLHAITDAVLGALALGDIGQWFSDQDPRWKGADSQQLLKAVLASPQVQGWSLINLDSTVIAEAPKLAPHIPAMREAIAALFGVDPGQISVKAKTAEKMGALGRREGVACQAVVLLRRG